MKSIYIVLSLFVVALLGSCSDFLTEKPTTSFSAPEIYSTEQGAESAMIGCYAALTNSSTWPGLVFEFVNNISGVFSYKGNPTGEQLYNTMLTMDGVSANLLSIYSQVYTCVNVTNDVIRNIGISPLPQEVKDELEGEARFLRAFNYFTIVRLWGRSPLITTPPTNIKDTQVPFAEINVIYKQILDDLTFAEEHMRAPRSEEGMGRTVQTNRSRVNYWAATALKAKVYAQIGCIIDNPDAPFTAAQADFTNCGIANRTEAWEMALSEGQKVEANGPYKLLGNYAALFDWANAPLTANSVESIFELQSTPLASGGYTTLRASPNFDARFTVINDNSSSGRVRPTREMFLRHWANEKYRAGVMTDPTGVTTGGSLDRDPRIDAAYQYMKYTVAANATAAETPPAAWGRTMYVFPALKGDQKSGSSPTNWYGDGRTAFPFINKYFDPGFTGSSKSNANMYLYRYADLLLVMAEAAAELGDMPTAVGYVNQLMLRARNSKTPASTKPVDWTVGEFADSKALVAEIMYERERELMAEGQDNFDTKRKGIAFFRDYIAKPHNLYLTRVNVSPYLGEPDLTTWKRVLATPRQVFGGANTGLSPNYGDDGVKLFPTDNDGIRKIMLLAIPQAEIDRNKKVTSADQNFGY